MAVVDKYVDTNVEANKKGNPASTSGAKVIAMIKTFEVAAADDDGSVYRVFPGLSGNLIPLNIEIMNDAITAGTDYDLGLYEFFPEGAGAVCDKDCFVDGADLSAAHTQATPLGGLSIINIADLGKRLYEYAGDTIATQVGTYDIALTANTVGTAAGTVTVAAQFLVTE
jgi:hypothetical protein